MNEDIVLLKAYLRLKNKSRQIAHEELDVPSFYINHEKQMKVSYEVLNTASVLLKCKAFLDRCILHPAHGVPHAETVAFDAGIIVMAETDAHNLDNPLTRELVIYAQAASILHDIKRNDDDHAYKGSLLADEFLKTLNVPLPWRSYVCAAIKNHEAFKTVEKPENDLAALLSNALYDADKFRWGPENFTKTVWVMVLNEKIPLQIFYQGFLKNLAFIEKIQHTFRTKTGEKYGPEFIKKGLHIGKGLYQELTRMITDENLNRAK
ncbi:MAG TPA: hypothetical protein VJL89_11770 [Thermodesulfovibrionia bacterium]|nr:hypothetical protein [Thermodesulfovibrionia bacterium]